MSLTQEDRDTLQAAIARGVKKVRIGGEEVEYASIPDMIRALNLIDQQLAGGAGGFAVVYPRTGRGL